MSQPESADRYQEARAAITGDSWLDDLARASISAAEAKFGPKPEHEVFVTPVEYRVTIMPEACLRLDGELRHWNLSVVPLAARFGYADDGWIVSDPPMVLGKDGTWAHGPQSEAEIAAWLASHVHARLGDALDAARDFAPKVTTNNLTAVEVLARHRARQLECCLA